MTNLDSASEMAGPVVVITEGGPHIWVIVNAVADRVGPVTVILETRASKWRLLRRRARRQGWLSAFGQLGTMALVRLLKRLKAPHVEHMASLDWLEMEPRPDQHIVEVASANAPETLATIDALQPAVVLLAGCRMLKAETLDRIPCPVINYHPGITPKYRGMNGGYWALATGDADNFGTTVHIVDAGVDTGTALRQIRGAPEPGDNIATYALRQAAFSRDMCAEAVADALAGRFYPFEPDMASRQWYHPTLWFYVWTGLSKGVW